MLNQALKLVRVYHNQSLTQLSQGIGLSKSYISEIEGGKKKVSMEVLEKYSSHFRIPTSSLMFFAEKTASGTGEDVRVFVADKVLKMLDWMSTIGDVQAASKA